MAQVYYVYRKNVGYLEQASTDDPNIDNLIFGTTDQVEEVARTAGSHKWNGSAVVACTAQETSDYASNVAADEVTDSRDKAKSALDVGGGKALRALAELVLSEINLLRAEHSLPARTRAQLKTAMDNTIDNGDAD